MSASKGEKMRLTIFTTCTNYKALTTANINANKVLISCLITIAQTLELKIFKHLEDKGKEKLLGILNFSKHF